MSTVAEILAAAEWKERLQRNAMVAVETQFPPAIVERFVDDSFACRGEPVRYQELVNALRERIDGLIRQIDPNAERIAPADRWEMLVDAIMTAVMRKAIEIAPGRMPPSGGGRRVAA